MRKLVIGLGNPGKQYAKTRHNLGARSVEAFAIENPEVDVLLPQEGTFMNDFGSLLKSLEVEPLKIVIVHDDIELPFGEIKFVESGSAKGHNGVRSIQRELGTTEIPRLRLGVGRPHLRQGFGGQAPSVEEFVLSNFYPEEEAQLPEMISRIVRILAEDD